MPLMAGRAGGLEAILVEVAVIEILMMLI